MAECSACGKKLLSSSGNLRSKILIVGSEPDGHDYEFGRPFTGDKGDALRKELNLAGLSPVLCRFTYIWKHYPLSTKKENEGKGAVIQNKLCLDKMMELIIEEMRTAEAILLVGADPVKILTGLGVSAVNGLPVFSQYISESTLVVACMSPGILVSRGGSLGDIRLPITRFSNWTRHLRS